jgi:hypothetical protein
MTNNKQQTAVEWFANESWQLKVQLDNQEISVDEYAVFYVRLLYKAKEKEKERMIDFANNCIKQIEVSDTCELLMVESPKDLYEQTYGGEEQ